MNDGRIRLEVTVPAPRAEVFRAWTDPELLARWFGPGEFSVPSATLDVRPGGSYEILMQPPGDGVPMPLIGTYQEIDEPQRLVFTWSWRRVWAEAPETLVVVEFADEGDHTVLTVTQGDFDTPEAAAPFEMGWTGGLQKLTDHFHRQETAS